MAGTKKPASTSAAKKPTAAKKPASAKKSPGFALRQGEPHASYGYTKPNGDAVELKADSQGVVAPSSVEDVAFLDGMGLATVEKSGAELHVVKSAAAIESVSEPPKAAHADVEETPADKPAAGNAEKGDS